MTSILRLQGDGDYSWEKDHDLKHFQICDLHSALEAAMNPP